MSQCTSGHGKQEKKLQVSQTKETIKIENKKLKLITRKISVKCILLTKVKPNKLIVV